MAVVTITELKSDNDLGDAQVGDYFPGNRGANNTGGLTYAPKLNMDTTPSLAGNLTINGHSINTGVSSILISPTELSYLDGVTSNIQTQFGGLQSQITTNTNNIATNTTNISTNTTDIANIVNGTTPVGRATSLYYNSFKTVEAIDPTSSDTNLTVQGGAGTATIATASSQTSASLKILAKNNGSVDFTGFNFVYRNNAGTGTITFTPSAVLAVNVTMPAVSGTMAVNTATGGGTAQTSWAQGDLLYASATNTLSKLTKDTNSTRYLSNTGSSNNPAWAQVNLANGVTGTLPVGNLNLADQATMEGAASNLTLVTPGRLQYHPASTKAWVLYTSITTTTITASYGVTSLTDNGTGNTTVNFSVTFSSATSYGTLATIDSNNVHMVVNTGATATTNTLASFTVAAPAAVDSVVMASYLGDLA